MGRIVNQDDLILRRAEWKHNGERVVFAGGVFDVLHPGHIRLLEQARSHGDILVVGIESDETQSAENRGRANQALAFTPRSERAEIIAAFAAVDFAVEFDPASLPGFLSRLAPDVIVRGAPPTTRQVANQQDIEFAGNSPQLIHIPLEPGHSTALLVERIKKLNA